MLVSVDKDMLQLAHAGQESSPSVYIMDPKTRWARTHTHGVWSGAVKADLILYRP